MQCHLTLHPSDFFVSLSCQAFINQKVHQGLHLGALYSAQSCIKVTYFNFKVLLSSFFKIPGRSNPIIIDNPVIITTIL